MEDSLLLPVLQPSSWEGWDVAVCRPLFGDDGPPLPGIPVVGFAYDAAEGMHPILLDDLTDEESPLSLEIAARNNLAPLAIEWEARSSGDEDTPSALIGRHPFAAELILSPRHMTEAQERLGTEGVAVAIPARGMIAVQDAFPADIDDLLGLLQWTHYVHEDAGEYGLSPRVFLVTDGEVKAVIQPPPEEDF